MSYLKLQNTVNERRLSRLATAGTVVAAILTDKGNVYKVFVLILLQEWDLC